MNDNKQLQVVKFEQAKRLKAAGFDWETRDYYVFDDESNALYEDEELSNYNGEHHLPVSWDEKEHCSAPTVALALKWARDVKGVRCYVKLAFTGSDSYGGYIEFDDDPKKYVMAKSGTYEEAESALLDAVLGEIEKVVTK